ncbi:MAG: endonuclease domain-containing protein [Xanthobacteraceae bacterium]
MPSHPPTRERLRIFAKQMRHAPTDAEAAMWRLLRSRQLAHFKFRRQTPLEGYILDFVCFEKRLVVEIDGGQHASSARDAIRSDALTKLGFDIARYWNNDVLQQPQAVLEDILSRLTARRA